MTKHKPLRKDMRFGGGSNDDFKFWVDDVLSALEGLQEELRGIEKNELDEGNVQYGIMAGIAQALVNKWFPILLSSDQKVGDLQDTDKVDSREQQSKQSFDAPRNDSVSLETDTYSSKKEAQP